MKLFSILEPFFHALSDGKIIRLTIAWVLRILAVLIALVGLAGGPGLSDPSQPR